MPRWKVCMLALDLSKAFDTVWHNALLYKLHAFGFPPYLIKIMRSYLSDRIMVLTTHESTATPKPVLHGVPQGSILGPLLFIIFLADMPKSPQALTCLYADDTALLTTSKNARRAVLTMQRVLQKIINYFEKWRMSVNPSKTQAIFFTGNSNTPFTPPLTLRGVVLPWANTITYLGIKLDRGLRMSAHALYLKRRVVSTYFQLASLLGPRSYLDPAVKILFYKVLLRTILQYAAPVWAPLMANVGWKDLQIAQSRPLRAAVAATKYMTNQAVHRDSGVPYIHDFLIEKSWKFYQSIRTRHPNLIPDADLNRRKVLSRFDILRPPDPPDQNPDEPD